MGWEPPEGTTHQPWQPPPPRFTPPPPNTNSGKATAALVLGIVGLTVCPLICSILALVFGYQGRAEIDRAGGGGNRGNAVAGIVLGWVGIGLVLAIVVLFVALGVSGEFDDPYYEDYEDIRSLLGGLA